MYAKLSPPDASRLIVRPRLHGLLDAGRGGTLWVTAPAGAGKTSLLGAWAQSLPSRLVWYRVDSADADPASFFEWFAQALEPAGRETLPRFAPENLLNLPHFARRFFRAGFAAMAADTVAVLDNVHDAAPGGAGEGAMAVLLQAMVHERAPRMTLVFSSRADPEGALLALQADPAHRHLRWPELRCTDEEAQALAGAWNLPMPTSGQLARAAGWMAALAVLLRQADAGSSTAWQSRPDAAVFDLFSAQAFSTLNVNEQQVLLVNAFVPWIDPASTDRLCGRADAQTLLDGLWRAQFFIERRMPVQEAVKEAARETGQEGKPCPQYICHPLLRAYLQDRARQLWPEADRHRQALHHAQAFEAMGDADAALASYLQAHAFESAARLAVQQAPALMAAGKVATLMDWLRRLGCDAMQAGGAGPLPASDFAPALAYWHGMCHLFTAPQQAIASFERAHAGHVAQGQTLAALFDVCAMMDAYFNQWDQWPDAQPWASELARLYDLVDSQEGGFANLDQLVRVLSSGMSLIFPCYDHPLVARWRLRAEEIMRTSAVPQHRMQLAGFVIGHAWWTGDAVRFREASRMAAHALTQTHASPTMAFHLHMWMGISRYSDGHAADPSSVDHFDQVLAIGQAQGVHLFDFHAWCHKIMKAMAVDDVAAGAHALQQARRLNPGVHGARQLLTLCEVAQHLMERNWQAAVALGRESLLASPDFGGWVFGAQTLRLGLAQGLVMLGEHEQACAHMEGPLDFARRLPSPYFDLMAHCVFAACALARSDVARADACLRRAFGIARGKGFRHLPPWWSPPFFAPLLARALEAGIEVDWVTQLIRQQRVAPPRADVAAWPYPVRIQVLGRFELVLNGQPQASQGKAQRRVLELLKALAAQGGRAVAAQTLADDLWPEGDGDASMAAFDVTLHRARKVLGHPQALLLHDARLSLNPDIVWLDLWALERVSARIGEGLSAQDPSPDVPTLRAWADTLARHMTGPLLAHEPDAAWLHAARAAWERRLERLALRLRAACVQAGLQQEAEELHARLAEVLPLSDAAARADMAGPGAAWRLGRGG